MVSFKALIAASFVAALVASKEATIVYHRDDLAMNTCVQLIAKKVTFFAKTAKLANYCSTKNQPALGTMAHCLEQMNEEYPTSRQVFLKSCAAANASLSVEKYLAAYYNATQYMISAPKIVNKTIPLVNAPINFTQPAVHSAWRSLETRFINYNYASWFGIALLAYWFFVMLVAGLCNLVYFIAPGLVNSMRGSLINTFRKYVTLPALGGKSHSHGYMFMRLIQLYFPTRLELILIFGFWALAIIFNAVLIDGVSPNFVWAVKLAEIGRKIGDRSGIMCLYLIPANILFAGRNNFMLWLTNWPYSRFINIHKHVSRLIFLMVLLHTVGLTYNGKGVGKYYTRNAQAYVRWGYVALVAASIMMVQSMRTVRRNNYELFLACHIILAVLFIMGGWLHCEDPGYPEWFYAATAVWCLDRVVRICRLVIFGAQTANVQLLANETLRVTVDRPAWWKPYPGCIAYIHFLRATCFWQSHPFTIVSEKGTKQIVFYIKVKGGMTHGLYGYLSKQPNMSANIKVSIEGPYGAVSSAYKFANQVFLAGGNGIPGLYYQAMSAISKGNKQVNFYWVIRHYRSLEWFDQELMSFKDTGVKPIIYVTQPHTGLIEPSGDGGIYASDSDSDLAEERGLQDSTHSPVEENKTSDNDSDEKKAGSSLDDSDHHGDHHLPDIESNQYILAAKKRYAGIVEFREGRPDVYELVREEIHGATGPIAITTCAHPSMVDEARKSVAQNLNESQYRVDLYEELQNW